MAEDLPSRQLTRDRRNSSVGNPLLAVDPVKVWRVRNLSLGKTPKVSDRNLMNVWNVGHFSVKKPLSETTRGFTQGRNLTRVGNVGSAFLRIDVTLERNPMNVGSVGKVSLLQPILFPSEPDNTCLICRKVFRRCSNLIAHERTHAGDQWYNCSECGKSFVSRAAFLIHQRVHTGEKPYKCSYCGKGFNTGSSLTRHKRIHTGEKPYKCLDCGKRFNDYSNFIVHKRIHTGEKPYECSVCGKRFSDNSNFIKHHH
uniref:C2H2-type domain-containing protein n=1 Tax=Naja naja TaxID=35670 RepID=A0A8C6XM00_NAJNA